MSWRPATGSLPEAAKGRRVKVKLRNGSVLGTEPVASACPTGWPADKTVNNSKAPYPRWSHARDPLEAQFDIVEWDFAT